MKQSSDASLLKSLAIAFGDGLAFGVGMKIVQASASARSAAPSPVSSAARAALPLPPGGSLDAQAFQRVLSSLEARLAEHVGIVDRRMAESEARVALELKGMDARAGQAQAALCSEVAARDSANARRLADVEQRLGGLLPSLEAQLAARLEAALEARIQAFVDARIEALEGRLHTDITEAGNQTAELLVQTIETRLLQRIAVLEGALASQGETIRLLRARSSGSQEKMHELLAGFRDACEQAIREFEQAQAEPEAGDDPDEPAGPVAGVNDGAGDTGDHRFDALKLVNYTPDDERPWSIPMVSSIALTLLAAGVMQFVRF